MTNNKKANFTTMKCCDIAATEKTVQECCNILHIQEDSGFRNQQQLIRGKRSNVCLARGMLSYTLSAHKLIVHIPRDYSSNFPHASNLKLGIADSSATSARICQNYTIAHLHILFMQGTNLLNYCANLGFYLIYYFV